MKEHKLNLKKLSRKQLINQVLIGIETMAHQDRCNDRLIEQNSSLNWYLKSAEHALEYKEQVIDKYKKLLQVSIEDL